MVKLVNTRDLKPLAKASRFDAECGHHSQIRKENIMWYNLYKVPYGKQIRLSDLGMVTSVGSYKTKEEAEKQIDKHLWHYIGTIYIKFNGK